MPPASTPKSGAGAITSGVVIVAVGEVAEALGLPGRLSGRRQVMIPSETWRPLRPQSGPGEALGALPDAKPRHVEACSARNASFRGRLPGGGVIEHIPEQGGLRASDRASDTACAGQRTLDRRSHPGPVMRTSGRPLQRDGDLAR